MAVANALVVLLHEALLEVAREEEAHAAMAAVSVPLSAPSGPSRASGDAHTTRGGLAGGETTSTTLTEAALDGLLDRVQWPLAAAVVYSVTGEIVFPDALRRVAKRVAFTPADAAGGADAAPLYDLRAGLQARYEAAVAQIPQLRHASLPRLLAAGHCAPSEAAGTDVNAPATESLANSSASAGKTTASAHRSAGRGGPRLPVTAALAGKYDPASPLHGLDAAPSSSAFAAGGDGGGSLAADGAATRDAPGTPGPAQTDWIAQERAASPAEGLWWRDGFSRMPSAAARWRLQQLRSNTPVGADTLAQLLERFFIVEGADIFFSPLSPHTVMEFNLVRSEPYRDTVLAPLCLTDVQHKILRGRRGLHGTAADIGLRRPREEGTAAAAAAAAAALPLSASGGDARLVTLMDLERDVWHIAANCVFFNAPESDFPMSARRFACACTSILVQYCVAQVI